MNYHFVFQHRFVTISGDPIRFTSRNFITNSSLILQSISFNNTLSKFKVPRCITDVCRTLPKTRFKIFFNYFECWCCKNKWINQTASRISHNFFFPFFHNFLTIPFHEYQGCHVFLFFSCYQYILVPLFIIITVITHFFLSYFVTFFQLFSFIIIKVIAQFFLFFFP